MRNTKQKELILNIVENSYDHKSALSIYEIAKISIPNIGLATIYRILNELIKIGKVKKIITNDGIEKFDRNEEHHHFICDKCGKIYDIFNYKLDDVKELEGFEIWELTFKGLCNDCNEKGI